ncbi:MAG: hypothetical protein AAB599_01315 [Patescibacteria group bacterium]
MATFFLGCYLISATPAHAIVDPLSSPNNRFGIHILNGTSLDEVANLVNTNGDWGYVTLVIQDDQRDTKKWQEVFDKLRETHLIPIVRIATHPEGENWVKPAIGEAPAWASFLDSLNWVVKNRYVVLFNEPNHAKEWGGQIAPTEYADVLYNYSQKLKKQNEDFFVLNAGFDSSAPNGIETRDQVSYIRSMLSHNPQVFEYIDGWTSHSYPNPDFSSPPEKHGRGGIKNYEWELSTLKSFGIQKDLPVFITETGWSGKNLSEEKVAQNFQKSFIEIWNDPKVAAVTPFVLDYQAEPFSSFSWKKPDGWKTQYQVIQSLGKTVGQPEQIEKIVIRDGIPEKFTTKNLYFMTLDLENLGQTIWKESDGYEIQIETPGVGSQITKGALENIKPFQIYKTGVALTTPEIPGSYSLKISLLKNGKEVSQTTVALILEELPEKPIDITKNHLKRFIEFLLNKLTNWK